MYTDSVSVNSPKFLAAYPYTQGPSTVKTMTSAAFFTGQPPTSTAYIFMVQPYLLTTYGYYQPAVINGATASQVASCTSMLYILYISVNVQSILEPKTHD